MAKPVNYTPEQTAELVAAYSAANTEETRSNVVTNFANKFGKSVASVRSKLVREKVYVAKVYKTKTGELAKDKNKMVSEIAILCGVDEELFDSLAKANKSVLSTLIYKLESAANKD